MRSYSMPACRTGRQLVVNLPAGGSKIVLLSLVHPYAEKILKTNSGTHYSAVRQNQ
jgi:hypothetical protein